MTAILALLPQQLNNRSACNHSQHWLCASAMTREEQPILFQRFGRHPDDLAGMAYPKSVKAQLECIGQAVSTERHPNACGDEAAHGCTAVAKLQP